MLKLWMARKMAVKRAMSKTQKVKRPLRQSAHFAARRASEASKTEKGGGLVSTAKGLVVPVYSTEGTKSGTISLSESVFGQELNTALLAQAVRVFLTNQRKSAPKTKTRGEVKKSTRKIYRQKGTGGARHGARSAPLFVGGGIAHGPKGVVPRLSFSQGMGRLALIQALSEKVREGKFMVADVEKIKVKTKIVAALLKKIGLGKGTLVIHNASQELFQAARNIEGVHVIPAGQISAYHVLAQENILSTKEAVKALESRLGVNT